MQTVVILFLMLCAGAIGGLLFGLRNKGLTLPRQKPDANTIELGFIKDCLFGLAGAFVIFLITPFDLEATEFTLTYVVRIIGLSLLGGYGGPLLIDKALSNTLENIKEEVKTEVDRHHSEKSNNDSKALQLVGIQLGDTCSPVEPIQELSNAIDAASPTTREGIFHMTKEARHNAWHQGKKGMIERTIPIFTALLKSDTSAQCHRHFAQLGYAYKDQQRPDWQQAEQALKQAIDLCKKIGKSTPAHYLFNWAVCVINLDNLEQLEQELAQQIRKDVKHALLKASSFPELDKVIQNDTRIAAWLKKHKLSLNTEMLQQAA